MLTLLVGVIVNVVLFSVKLYVGTASGSISIFSDGINNLGDVLTCAIAIFCFYFIKNKTNKDVTRGYGRLEYVASMLMALVVCVVGITFLTSAVDRLVLASLIVFRWTYFGILIGAMVLKAGLGVFYYQCNKKLNSDVIKCAFYDSILDSAVTAMTIIGTLLTKYIQLRLDAVFGIIVSVIMLVGGIKLFIDGIKSILGKKLNEETVDKIKEFVLTRTEIEEVTSLELHDYGVNNKILILEVIFTKDITCDILYKVVEELTASVSEKFGYDVRITVSTR